MSVAVVDTNVVLVANGQHADVSPECVIACVRTLQDVMRSERWRSTTAFKFFWSIRTGPSPRRETGRAMPS